MMRAILVTCLCLVPLSQGFVRLHPSKFEVSRPRTIVGDPASDAYIDQVIENLRQLIIENVSHALML